jgi:hypothetical protein
MCHDGVHEAVELGDASEKLWMMVAAEACSVFLVGLGLKWAMPF